MLRASAVVGLKAPPVTSSKAAAISIMAALHLTDCVMEQRTL